MVPLATDLGRACRLMPTVRCSNEDNRRRRLARQLLTLLFLETRSPQPQLQFKL